MRLQKFMAESGVASRRKCELLIEGGHVTVNGIRAQLGMSVEPKDEVRLDGKLLTVEQEQVVIMLNKPAGMLCTADDPKGRETVMDYFKDFPVRLYNVGRLDYDSEGLLLLTNDGELTFRMTHPSFAVEKTYHVICDGELSQAHCEQLQAGVELEEGKTAPAGVSNLRRLKNGNTSLDITIHEGRNRQVRRMLEALGHETLLLRRVQVGCLQLNGLETGKWRRLQPQELNELYKLVKLK